DFHVTGVQTCALPILNIPKLTDERRRIRPGVAIALAALLLAAGAAILFARQERQSALDRRLIEALRRAHYADARALLDQGADAKDRKSTRLNSSHVKI